jgi:ABC-type methionine transport system ATPase subunit
MVETFCEPAVEFCCVAVDRDGDRLLDDISMTCQAGEITLVCGASGSGKTTLLRLINGLCCPTAGLVKILGSRIPGRSAGEARRVWRQSGTVLQEIALFETRTALRNVELVLRASGCDQSTARERAVYWLAQLGLGDKLHAYPCCLSGGQRQRVALARSLAAEPRLLILDEPTSALDAQASAHVLGLIRELAGQGTAVVMSSHKIEECLDTCDQFIELHRGRIVRQDRCPSTVIRFDPVKYRPAYCHPQSLSPDYQGDPAWTCDDKTSAGSPSS